MAWAKVDDQLHAHPKTNRAFAICPASLGLHLMAMSYSACFDLDGFVDDVFVAGKLPAAALRRKATRALEEACIWHRVDGGWQIHGWAEYNGDAAEREAARQAKAAAGRKGAAKRWQTNGTSHSTSHESANGTHDGNVVAADGSRAPTRAFPSPSPVSGVPDTARERVRFNGKVVPAERVDVALAILEDFNQREGTPYKPFGAGGKPTEPFKRLLGALIDRPHVGTELGKRVNEVCLTADRFWDGVAQPGNVWGPNVVDRNVAKAMGAGERRSSSLDGLDWGDSA